MEHVILVDEADREVGAMEKMEAHEKGETHRAFSIFVFNGRRELLLHQRAASKYHSGGLWTNTCCSHPRPGEAVTEAAHRRLVEEMGFDCDLREIFAFHYRAELDGGLIEDEVDHVLIGEFSGEPQPNPEEVQDYAWLNLDALTADIRQRPDKYSFWLNVAIDRVVAHVAGLA